MGLNKTFLGQFFSYIMNSVPFVKMKHECLIHVYFKRLGSDKFSHILLDMEST